ncbi:hypothetical protein RchiOBHm_Chr2g0102551 [Rosa chinensis]|uniref:Uncharacterized protein n=1 Tax=Rosa chinensis TaxID=74649 RepID=A0A2P6RMN9_ROSCH|nr:hypothetical protein RchiOBHm_Chr2g0102551 [Rosa chinensis]
MIDFRFILFTIRQIFSRYKCGERNERRRRGARGSGDGAARLKVFSSFWRTDRQRGSSGRYSSRFSPFIFG